MIHSLTDEQTSVLVGSMLGDGHLALETNNRCINSRFIVRRGIQDEAYLLWEHALFSGFCSSKAIRRYSDYNKTTDKSYPGISFTTLSHPIFTEYHHKWYADIKRVPRDLELNQLVMLIWFLDDGFVERTKSGKFAIRFSTDGFYDDDVWFLCELLRQRYGHNYTAYRNSKGISGRGLRIYGHGLAADAIIEDMLPIFPNDLMGRKAIWALPYTPKIHTYDIKREKIDEYLATNDEFYLNDLGRFAGFTFQRKSRKGGIEVATTNLTRHYLSSYLEKGFIVKVPGDRYHSGSKYELTEPGKMYFREGV